MIGTQLELSSRERFPEQDLDDSYSNKVEHEINSTNFSTVNPILVNFRRFWIFAPYATTLWIAAINLPENTWQ